MKKNNISITTKDARRNTDYAQELIKGGGKLQVPCLKIVSDKTEWMYESKDIISFLDNYLEINDAK